MEKVIELDREIKTHTLMQSDLFKVIKFVFIGGLLLVAADYAKKGYLEGERRLESWKESYISSYLAASLASTTIEFDDRKAIAKPATTMSRDELLRAIYLLNQRVEQRDSTINHLKEILSYED